MESAAHLDVMKLEELIDDERYAVGSYFSTASSPCSPR